MRNIYLTIAVLLICVFEQLYSQEKLNDSIGESSQEKLTPPPYNLFRAEENYDYLKNKEENPYKSDYADPIKFIGLNESKSINFSFGGEIRPRFEHFTNRNWQTNDISYYSQRISLHTNINITKYFRVFGEIYHGLISEGKEIPESDEIDFHQAFIEFKVPISEQSLSIRLGRQEMAFGSTRLVGLREGPNIRQDYDLIRTTYHGTNSNIDVFYGKEVFPSFGAFDNKSNFFNSDGPNAKFWGIYSQFQLKQKSGKTELYYLGFDKPFSTYDDASGNDIRHSLGIRRFQNISKAIRHNTELTYQFGKTGNKNVSAWAFETEWHYLFYNAEIRPEIGLKLDIISGDKTNGDDKVQTFNPLFSNPAYFNLAAVLAPANMINIHPSFSMKPTKKMNIYLEWISLFRYSNNDGIYSPPRFLFQSGQQTNERYIGSQFGMELNYQFDRHLSFTLDFSYFITGNFLDATGNTKNNLHVAPTFSYKF